MQFIFLLKFISAYFTTQSVFFSIGIVLAFKWTIFWTRALLYLIVSSYLMARFTEMGCTPTMPFSLGAAVLAFIFYEIFSMLLTSGLAWIEIYGLTKTTNKILWFWLIFLLCFFCTIPHTSKVWMLTLEALIECKFKQSIFLKFIIEPIFRI